MDDLGRDGGCNFGVGARMRGLGLWERLVAQGDQQLARGSLERKIEMCEGGERKVE